MVVLARELESYERALREYRRAASKYNERADAHNEKARAFTDSLVRDEHGRPYAVYSGRGSGTHGEGSARFVFVVNEDGSLQRTSWPLDMDKREFELSPAKPGEDGLMLVHYPAKEKRTETVSGLMLARSTDDMDPFQSGFVFDRGRTADDNVDAINPRHFYQSGFGQPWRIEPERVPNPLATGPWNEFSDFMMDDRDKTFAATREVSVLPESPGEWQEEFTMVEPTAPDPTLGAARRLGRPSLAAMEGGLISEAIRGRGVR